MCLKRKPLGAETLEGERKARRALKENSGAEGKIIWASNKETDWEHTLFGFSKMQPCVLLFVVHPDMLWNMFTVFFLFNSRYLDLDLVVRDKDGNILDPELTSTVSLFREHEAASKQIEDRIQEEKVSKRRIMVLLLNLKQFKEKEHGAKIQVHIYLFQNFC